MAAGGGRACARRPACTTGPLSRRPLPQAEPPPSPHLPKAPARCAAGPAARPRPRPAPAPRSPTRRPTLPRRLRSSVRRRAMWSLAVHTTAGDSVCSNSPSCTLPAWGATPPRCARRCGGTMGTPRRRGASCACAARLPCAGGRCLCSWRWSRYGRWEHACQCVCVRVRVCVCVRARVCGLRHAEACGLPAARDP
jgi:hypothetical protein